MADLALRSPDQPNGVLPSEQQKALDQVLAFQKGPGQMREAAIKAFSDA